MGSKRLFFLVAGFVLLVGFLFSLVNPVRAVAENAKAMLVEVVNLPLDNDTYSVRTLPVKDQLVDGFQFVSTYPVTGYPSEVVIPDGVVVTDIVVNLHESESPCNVTLKLEDYSLEYKLIMYYGITDRITELHLNSGLLSTEERPIIIRLDSSHCLAGILWTGYQY